MAGTIDPDTVLNNLQSKTTEFVNSVSKDQAINIAHAMKLADDQIRDLEKCDSDVTAASALVRFILAKKKGLYEVKRLAMEGLFKGLQGYEQLQPWIGELSVPGSTAGGQQASPGRQRNLTEAFHPTEAFRRASSELAGRFTSQEVHTIAGELFSGNLIFMAEKEDIVSQPTSTAKARCLLDTIYKKGDQCIVKFCEILRHSDVNRSELADLIR